MVQRTRDAGEEREARTPEERRGDGNIYRRRRITWTGAQRLIIGIDEPTEHLMGRHDEGVTESEKSKRVRRALVSASYGYKSVQYEHVRLYSSN